MTDTSVHLPPPGQRPAPHLHRPVQHQAGHVGLPRLRLPALRQPDLHLPAPAPPQPHGPGPEDVFDIPFTSVSSFVLLMSSLTMALAVAAIARGDVHRSRVWLATTAMLGAVFIGGQVYEFTTFYREGLGYTTNIFGSAFYTLTGFHGVHVSVGIVMLMSLLVMSLRGNLGTERAEAVEIVGLYWHFVDIVWILIFTIVYLIP